MKRNRHTANGPHYGRDNCFVLCCVCGSVREGLCACVGVVLFRSSLLSALRTLLNIFGECPPGRGCCSLSRGESFHLSPLSLFGCLLFLWRSRPTPPAHLCLYLSLAPPLVCGIPHPLVLSMKCTDFLLWPRLGTWRS